MESLHNYFSVNTDAVIILGLAAHFLLHTTDSLNFFYVLPSLPATLSFSNLIIFSSSKYNRSKIIWSEDCLCEIKL